MSHRELRDSGVMSDDSVEDDVDIISIEELRVAESSRYMFRSQTYRMGHGNVLLSTELELVRMFESDQRWLNDAEFLQKYRMSRSSLNIFASKIENHPVFHTNTAKPQTAPKYQLACFLLYIGLYGSGALSAGMRNTQGYGYGTFALFYARTMTAIWSFRCEYIQWPGEEKRSRIGRRFFDNHNLPNCVGIADGTLFPFSRKPGTDNASDYVGRKLGYTMTCMIICDDQRLIRYYLTGVPGSIHDNRVFRNMNLCRHPEEFFLPREYLIGDSAFENRNFMVLAFKNLPGITMLHDRHLFNTTIGRAWVISEHTIGLLKSCFC